MADVLPERVQREVPQKKISEGGDKVAITNYIAAFDAAVQKAFAYVLHKPSLPDFADVDNGHLQHWKETWTRYLLGSPTALPAAAFGYAVEALTELIFLPDPPSGMRATAQQTRGGTRPDFVLSKDNVDIAWIDITASNSENHIYNKEDWNRVANFAEVTYPSTNLGQIRQVAQSDEGKNFTIDNFDPEAAKARLKRAQALQQFRREWWKGYGRALFPDPPSASSIFRDEVRRKFAVRKLNVQFGLRLKTDNADHLRLTGSVLYAMGMSPLTWGFVNYSVSKSQGESFLMEYDPHLTEIDTLFAKEYDK